jgi:hypothetical protein
MRHCKKIHRHPTGPYGQLNWGTVKLTNYLIDSFRLDLIYSDHRVKGGVILTHPNYYGN